ncbi:MAG: hypothetical protein JWR38_496 [Mucilaginibacter sp.]|nr:hypothetical protein [Mucilaginibacter sp.]
MKQILLIALITFFYLPVFSQSIPIIKASEAQSYVGKLVFLKDTIRSGIIVNDSIAVLRVGGKLDKDAISIVISSKGSRHSLDSRLITTLQRAEADFKGVIIPVASGFIIIVDDDRAIHINKYLK